ncbi:hypothetical protein I5L29_01965 [Serratia marcescens]|nr:hypothetical protein [Serratia marcescens]HEP1044338.1 hypothetical protein [Serratia marcescens]
MESISSEIFDILKYLLPGFVTAWIFHALTAHPKKNQFEQIIQALIFTLFIQCAIVITKYFSFKIGQYYSLGRWNEKSEFLLSVYFSISLGINFVVFANNGYFHEFLAKMKVTKQTPYPSEWEDIFNQETSYVIVNLKNGRRIYGWPRIYPSDPTKGHLILQNPEWIIRGKLKKLDAAEYITICVSDIEYVEFLKPPENSNDVQTESE